MTGEPYINPQGNDGLCPLGFPMQLLVTQEISYWLTLILYFSGINTVIKALLARAILHAITYILVSDHLLEPSVLFA